MNNPRYNITLWNLRPQGSWSPLRPTLKSKPGFTANQVEAVIHEAVTGGYDSLDIQPRN